MANDPIARLRRRQELYASLHERLSGTEGVHELAELQSIEREIADFTAEKYHEIITNAENPGR